VCSGGEGGNEYCKVEQSACCLDLSTYSVIVHVGGVKGVSRLQRKSNCDATDVDFLATDNETGGENQIAMPPTLTFWRPTMRRVASSAGAGSAA
jgi:hypothetical protein